LAAREVPPSGSSSGIQTSAKIMCRLAVIHHPPNGFWKNSRNKKIT